MTKQHPTTPSSTLAQAFQNTVADIQPDPLEHARSLADLFADRWPVKPDHQTSATARTMTLALEAAFPGVLAKDAWHVWSTADCVLARRMTANTPEAWGLWWDHATRNLLVREAHDITTRAWPDSLKAADAMSVSIHQDHARVGARVHLAIELNAARHATNPQPTTESSAS